MLVGILKLEGLLSFEQDFDQKKAKK